jgi:uncharacterized cupredoxin-like copper-binding protein
MRGPRHRLRRLGAMVALTAVAVLLAAGCGDETTAAHPASTTVTSDTPGAAPATALEVIATDHAYHLSAATLAPGTVPVRLVNDGDEPHQVMIARLADGVSVDDYLAAVGEDELAADALIEHAGGVSIVDAGTEATGYADLTPGRYVLLCYIPASDGVGHLQHGMAAELTVAEHAEVAAPTPVADIVMSDFGFTLPSDGSLEAGTYRFVNEGRQDHELVLMRLEEGHTLADVIGYLQAGFQGDKPFRFTGGSGGVEPGRDAYADLTLTSGDYVAMCFVPDPVSHKHHVELGMLAAFTVP